MPNLAKIVDGLHLLCYIVIANGYCHRVVAMLSIRRASLGLRRRAARMPFYFYDAHARRKYEKT
jgi:hypothetical protein